MTTDPQLRARAEELGRDVGRAIDVAAGAPGPCALLLFRPGYNVGDPLIWAASLAYLGDRGFDVRFVARGARTDWAALRRALPSGGTVFLAGGNNIGDLHRPAHEFQLEAMRQCPTARIVLLPQSVNEISTPTAATMARAIVEHGDVHLLLRDERSAAVAAEAITPEAVLCPDIAFFHTRAVAPAGSGDADRGVVYLRRDDMEVRPPGDAVARDIPASWTVGDWPETPEGRAAALLLRGCTRAFRVTEWGRLGGGSGPARIGGSLLQRARAPLSSAIADTRVEIGASFLRGHSLVVTDRLHGHVMATLLGIPSIVLDNRDGKVHRFVATWTADIPSVRMAASLEEAVSEASR